MQAQLMMPEWRERTPAQEEDNADKVVNTAMECGFSCLRLLVYANCQHINVCKNLIMSNMEVESSLRWLSASTMTKMNHFYSTSDHVPQNLSQVGWVWLFKAAIICLWTAYQYTHILCNVWDEVGKKFEMAVSINPDVMTSFWLHKWPRTPKSDPSRAGITV